MRRKTKFLILSFVIILLTGCGQTGGKHSKETESNMPMLIKECCQENELIENINVQDGMEACKEFDKYMEESTGQYSLQIDQYVLQNLIDSVEKEKEKDYTITCIDRLYYGLQADLSPEDWETFQIYLPVLRGETVFYYAAAMDYENSIEKTAEDGSFSISYPYTEEITINDYYEFMEQIWYAYNWIECVSLTDLDGDGEKELIIRTVYDGRTLVLHRENNKIYWIDFWYRMFEDLQENGIHMGSGGAGHLSYHQLEFQDDMFVWKELATREGLEFYIGGQEVSETELNEWELAHIKQNARWYEINVEEDQVLSAYEQLEIFAGNYEEWMGEKGNTYHYCVYDFDQDGRLELLVTVKKMYGIENHFYQVEGEEIKELEQDYYDIKGKEFDICNRTTTAFHDKSTGIIYYEAQNYEDSNGVYNYGYFYMENEKICHVLVSVVKSDENGQAHYFDENRTGNREIDRDTFAALNNEIENGKVKTWIDLEPVEWGDKSSLTYFDIVLSNLIASYQGGEY